MTYWKTTKQHTRGIHMDFNTAIAQAKSAGLKAHDGATNPDELIKSEFYIRVGLEAVNPETDKMDFISLPQPLYLDSMKKNRILGEGEFPELLSKGNALLDQILAQANEMLEPGETKEMKLKVILCRRKAPVESKPVSMKFVLF